ncbi:MAG TPA: FtsX-like permease family protein [Micromonosporaceae bacterium]
MVWRLSPWRRGPLLLLKRPGVALALLAAAFVAALPAAAAPQFLDSARSAALHHQLAQGCAATAGLQVFAPIAFTAPTWSPATPVGPDVLADRARLVDRVRAHTPGLGEPAYTLYTTLDAQPVGRAPRQKHATALTVLGRDGFADHVQVLQGPSGRGLWLPDTYAAAQGISVGDRLTLRGYQGPGSLITGGASASGTVTIPVAGIYRDLRSLPDAPFWCGEKELYRGRPGQDESNTPVLATALVDAATLTGVEQRIGQNGIEGIEVPVARPDRITSRQAKELADGIQRAIATFHADPAFDSGEQDRFGFRTRVDYAVHRAELVRAGLLPPVVPVTAAGTLVGLVVVAAAAIFWVQRRRQELLVLAAHGVGAGSLGLKAAAEALPALLVGSVVGWASAWALVRWVGPDPVLDASSVPLAVAAAGVTLVVSSLLVTGVAAIRCRALTDQVPAHRRHRVLAALPWELALLVAAPLVWQASSGDRQLADDPSHGVGSVAHLPARLLVVPILVVAGAALLGGRLGVWWLRRSSHRSAPRQPARLLARRRIAKEAIATAVLAGATAVPIALAAYGASVNGSVQDTVVAEAELHVGSDLVATLTEPAPVPPALAGRATMVVRIDGLLVGGYRTDVLAVDPATFAQGAYWDDRIPGPSLSSLAADLTAGDPPTMIATAPVPDGSTVIDWTSGHSGAYQVKQVDTLAARQGNYPVALVDRASLPDELLRYGHPQMWVRGDPVASAAALAAAKIHVYRVERADEFYNGTVYEPVTYTFEYIVALSVLTGLIAVVGLLLYLESRTPAHRRAYVLLRRMGLAARQHRSALVTELAVPLTVGLVAGLALTAGLVAALAREFTVDPDSPPGTLVAVPTTTVSVLIAAVAVVAIGAASLAQYRVSRANPSEVLRDTV